MVKIMGGGLILLAGVIHAYDFRMRQRSAIHDLRFYCDMVEHVQTQISYFSLPYLKILEEYDPLAEKTPEAMLQALDTKQYLTAAEKKVVSDWICHLGDGYKDEQLKRCAYAKEVLGRFLETRQREYPNKIKVNNALSLLSGVSLILLLI